MHALEAGIMAPDFTLPTVDGQQVSLTDALKKGPVLLAFFKVSCPVCQYAFPFFDRIFQANRGGKVTVLGVSQDNAKNTQAFVRDYGVTFPVAIDDGSSGYATSNAYGLTNVPTAFLVASSGEIEISTIGWSKSDVEAINQRLANYRHEKPAPIWRAGESVQEFRGG
jgi:peroxiredoxin